MKITKRIRDEAILICAIAASTDPERTASACTDDAAVADLANRALNQVWEIHNDGIFTAEGVRADYAEAECLLRDGWSPK